MDETSQKIIDATMSLIRDKGYVATASFEQELTKTARQEYIRYSVRLFVNGIAKL